MRSARQIRSLSSTPAGTIAFLAPICWLIFFCLSFGFCLSFACCLSFAQNAGSKKPPTVAPSGDQAMIARGKYIVEGVARCAQCHTPRNAQGEFDHSHWLEGAAVWLQPAHPVEGWPLIAPRLSGNPPGTDDEMVTLLTTGVWRDGKELRQPMPQFRMTTEDAKAVVAYLKSLVPPR